MAKALKLWHKDIMPYTRECFLLEEPRETTVTLYTVVVLVMICIGLIIFGKVDEVVKATGIVRTQANVSSVENVIAGKIIELDYVRGGKVAKGDLLYKLDPTVFAAQLQNLKAEHKDLIQKIKDSENLKKSFYAGKNLCDVNDKVSYSRFEAFLRNKEELEIQIKLAQQAYLQEKSKPPVLTSPIIVKQRKLEYEYARSNLETFNSSFLEKLNAENYEYSLALSKSDEKIRQIESQYEFLNVYSPVDGYVQEIASLNIGDYVEAGKSVINIIPNDLKNFRVEILVAAKDMGKIKVGQKVKYRLAAFPYFEYQGALGKITAIDPDSRNRQNLLLGAISSGGQSKTSGGSGLYYCVYADIDRIQFSNRKGDSFPIKAGLETNARIVLERNTILMFILKKMDFLY